MWRRLKVEAVEVERTMTERKSSLWYGIDRPSRVVYGYGCCFGPKASRTW